MSVQEVSLIALIEAGQLRTLAASSFRLPLPASLIWGTEVVGRIEAIADEIESWPPIDHLEAVVILNRDTRQLIRAGACNTFDTPYQLVLFERMLESVWNGYSVEAVPMEAAALRVALGQDLPGTDASIPGELFSSALGTDVDKDDWEDEAGQGSGDFRSLTTTDRFEGGQRDDEYDTDDDEEQWWVSVRGAVDRDTVDPNGRGEFRHFIGSAIWKSLQGSGPDVLQQLEQLPDASVPDESDTTRGILIDAVTRHISLWSYPRGIDDPDALGDAWSGWAVTPWHEDGFRRQLDAAGEQTFIPASDTAVLAEFVPMLIEQPDLSEAIGEIKSSFRSFVWRGFGCLAVVLAIPTALASLLSGSWKGPVGFAVGLWLVAYVGYRLVVRTAKKAFAPITEGTFNQDAILPKLGPEPQEERERLIDDALAAARLPSLDQINSFAEYHDGDDGEAIEPIVRAD